MKSEEIAEIVHAAIRAYCLVIGDYQPRWGNLAYDLRDSEIDAVNRILRNPTITPEDMHSHWFAARVTAGWKYGPVKDSEKKEHPCLVKWENLPADQQKKSALFVSIVHAIKDRENGIASRNNTFFFNFI